MILIYILIAIVIIGGVVFLRTLVKLYTGNKRVFNELSASRPEKLTGIGAVKKLTILPLVDFHAVDERFKTEAGVSYLVKADDTTILMDVGFNKAPQHEYPGRFTG